VLPFDALQTPLEVGADLARALHQPFVNQHAQGGAADSRAERVAAEGAAVVARPQQAQHLAVGQHGRDGVEAAAERLAQRDHVRPDAFVVAAQQRAGAAEAGLNLIGDEQDVVGGANLGRALQVARRGHAHAPFALDRLDQEGDGVGRDGLFQRVGVIVRDHDEAGGQRAELLFVLRFAGEADQGGGAPGEVAFADDDLGLVVGHALHLVAPLAGGLDGRLDRFRAGVHRQGHFVAG